jgi:hypothetical protein
MAGTGTASLLWLHIVLIRAQRDTQYDKQNTQWYDQLIQQDMYMLCSSRVTSWMTARMTIEKVISSIVKAWEPERVTCVLNYETSKRKTGSKGKSENYNQ